MSNESSTEKGITSLAHIDRNIHSPARLMIMTYLYVVDRVDYTFLSNLTELSWGNLATHLKKLEEVKYVEMEKTFKDNKPLTMIHLTAEGRRAFDSYRSNMEEVFASLPDEKK